MVRLPRWLLIFLILVITAAWLVSFVAGLYVKDYNPPESINLVFSAMAAGILSQLSKSDKNDKDGDGDGS